MKAESNVMPQSPFVIDRRGELVDVTFFENAREAIVDGVTCWQYDSYTLTVLHRDGLESEIATNYDTWLASAIEKDETVEDVSTDEMLNVIFGGV